MKPAVRIRRGDVVGVVAPSGVVDFDRVRESARRNSGIELLGPPPFAMAAG